ncbi:MAG: hypothetical protein JXQ75_12250 [Phycisphaerae bacterium]|nr:hypothetical protein [Phycisphaerae bacterium]
MKCNFSPPLHSLSLALAAMIAAATFTGCEDDDDSYYDHDPPDGQGTLMVVNNTRDHISVFINGAAQERTSERSWRPYDLDPGVYRVVLEQQGGERNFSDDVDILENRLTILDVDIDPDDLYRYDVLLRYD